ncbi:hypothetical protein K661_02727 [Piscirickettsia salmonis LF-89 = ATCC VR-1361]|nr:hypothetical protein K661_02727 [Piscirickettsia salmonis LF-89 = ATCC VR-1361]
MLIITILQYPLLIKSINFINSINKNYQSKVTLSQALYHSMVYYPLKI